MPPRNRQLFSVLLVVLFVIAALPLVRTFSQRNDIWWTPEAMAVPLSESQDRVQILVRDQTLPALFETGQLQVVEGGAPRVIGTGDVRFRFNNWDHVRASRLPMLVANAAVCGAIAALFFVVATGRLAYRDRETRE